MNWPNVLPGTTAAEEVLPLWGLKWFIQPSVLFYIFGLY